MIRHLIVCAIAILTMFANNIAQDKPGITAVRVLNQSGVEGIAGVVLLVNPGDTIKSQAFVTDSDGRASVPHLKCDICTITAQDPRGLFFSKTTEFNAQDSSLTLTLEVKPIIDTVGSSELRKMKFIVHGPSGEPLPHQRVTVRPRLVTIERNWVYLETTDSKGLISARLLPGQYTIATLLGNKPWEASVRVADTRSTKDSRKYHIPGEAPSTIISVRLSAADEAPR